MVAVEGQLVVSAKFAETGVIMDDVQNISFKKQDNTIKRDHL
jgi:hypothetical protein